MNMIMANITTHFEAQWKNGIFGKAKVGLCSKFAMRQPRGQQTTTDKEKVDCQRCAKSLGITAAAKDTNGMGTCQCCFRQLTCGKGVMSLHGFSRPGHGYLIGECRGQKHLPYEVSCEQTKVWREELAGILVANENYLGHLKAGKVNELTVMVQTDDYHQTHSGRVDYNKPVYKPLTVKKGDAQQPNPFVKDRARSSWTVKSFADVLKSKITETEGTISLIKSELEMMDTRIKEWKKVR